MCMLIIGALSGLLSRFKSTLQLIAPMVYPNTKIMHLAIVGIRGTLSGIGIRAITSITGGQRAE